MFEEADPEEFPSPEDFKKELKDFIYLEGNIPNTDIYPAVVA